MAVTPALDAALSAIAARLTAQTGATVQRGRRMLIQPEAETLPRLVLRVGDATEERDDGHGRTLLRCSADIEGYVRAARASADQDAALELALLNLHAACHAALVGVEVSYGTVGDTLVCEGRGFSPVAPLLDESAEAIGGFTWSIGFDIRAAVGTGPYTTI